MKKHSATMKTMTKRFIKKWQKCESINPIRKNMPSWMFVAIQLDADIKDFLWQQRYIAISKN